MSEPATTPIYCANHPGRETGLRCHRCDKPICYECAIKTPVGQICRECYRSARAKYYNGEPYDLPIGIAVSLIMGALFGALAYLFLGRIFFIGFIIAFVAGPAAGGAVAEVIRRLLRRRRAQGMKPAATVAFVVGFLGFGFFTAGIPGMFFFWSALLFGALAASTLFARLL
jgi:hypothetical protein